MNNLISEEQKEFTRRFQTLSRENGYKKPEDFAEAYSELYPEDCHKNGTTIIPTPSFRDYENYAKKKNPTMNRLVNICKMLGCSMDYLCRGIDNPVSSNDVLKEVFGFESHTADWIKGTYRPDKRRGTIEGQKQYKSSISDFLNWIVHETVLTIEGEEYGIGEASFSPSLLRIEQDVILAISYSIKETGMTSDEYSDWVKNFGAKINAELFKHNAGIAPSHEMKELYINRAVESFRELLSEYVDNRAKKYKETAPGAGGAEDGHSGQDEAPAL